MIAKYISHTEIYIHVNPDFVKKARNENFSLSLKLPKRYY